MKNINSSQLEVKSRRLTRAERAEFVLSAELKDILVGLFLGDLYGQKKTINSNVHLQFVQGLVNKDYLQHLYELFKNYCTAAPKISDMLPDKRTGKAYSRIRFNTYSLPCFNELYDSFYPEGKKIIPSNIFDLITPLGIAYWICDDGYFDKRGRAVVIATQGFSPEEVNLLGKILTDKFNLKCSINLSNGGFIVRISAKSLLVLQSLLSPVMPPMMRHKIGLS